MKKLALLITIAAATTAFDAAALDTTVTRRLVVDSPFGELPLGTLQVVALGANGDSCDYLADITHPFNSNDVALCVLKERRTAFAPSCIQNETENVTTIIEAGSTASGESAPCAGFNLKGEAYDDVSLLLTESPCGGLVGIQVIHQSGGVPIVYPIKAME